MHGTAGWRLENVSMQGGDGRQNGLAKGETRGKLATSPGRAEGLPLLLQRHVHLALVPLLLGDVPGLRTFGDIPTDQLD